jgi:hypothetical protein
MLNSSSFFFLRNSPQWTKASSFTRFLYPHNDAPQSVELFWTNDQPEAESSTWQHTTLTTNKTPMTPVEFEPTISAGERPQTHALERAANGTSLNYFKFLKIVKVEEFCYFCGTAHSTGASGRQSEHHTMVSVKQSLDTPACHAVNGVRV